MVKIIVAGAAGRMGKRIINLIQQDQETELAGAFEHPKHPLVGEDAGVAAGTGFSGIKITSSLEEVVKKGQVLIDFTLPQATLANICQAAPHGLSMVIGTTGLTADNIKEIKNFSKSISCVLAPNMSVGVNVMFKIVKEMAHLLGQNYDMEIMEVHHRLKQDAPSGTAIRLAQIIADATGRNLDKSGVYCRKGIIGERTRDEIGIQTMRAGDITGEHTVMFGGTGERLELIHRAHNRDNFARGAIRAALWVVKQPKGLYDMQDVLGIK